VRNVGLAVIDRTIRRFYPDANVQFNRSDDTNAYVLHVTIAARDVVASLIEPYFFQRCDQDRDRLIQEQE
jgi:hypothetical protein